MTTASIDGTVIAESDDTVVVEGSHYFPAESVEWKYFTEVDHSTVCAWKGTASYYDVKVGDQELARVAWTYREPKDEAAQIKGHVAFYRQVTVQ